MIEAFRIGVQMTMDAADTQSTVASLAREFTSLNQQITQSQSGLSAVRAGLFDLAGQHKALQRDQDLGQTSAIWQAAEGLPRREPMGAMAPMGFYPQQHDAVSVAAEMIPISVAATNPVIPIGLTTKDGPAAGEELPTKTQSERTVFDPANGILPSLDALLSRNELRSTALPDLALGRQSVPQGGDGIGRSDLSDRAAGNTYLTASDRLMLDELSGCISGVAGAITVRDFGAVNASPWDFPTKARDELSDREIQAHNYPSDSTPPEAWPVGNPDSGTASTLALAVAGLTSAATDAARLIATSTGVWGTAASQDQSRQAILAPLFPEAPGIRSEEPASGASDVADPARSPDGGRTAEAPLMVIHTNVHLDGQVIAQAVTQQIVDWMNGPLSGAGGFDPRRSYTPVEN